MSLSTSAQGQAQQSPSGGPDAGRRLVGVGRAHGKAILLGEHAVVYGAPALAVPVPRLTTTATVARFPHQPGDGDMSFTMSGLTARPVVLQATDGLRRLVAEFMKLTGTAGAWRLDVIIDCLIPPSRGLGSSAACARAVAHALADLFASRLDDRAVFDLVQIAETVAHGRASGVDALATGSPSPILFHDGRARELRFGFDGLIVIADSGAAGSTKEAVELLRRGFERNPGAREEFVRRAEELAQAAVRDLARGAARDFGARLTDNHELLSAAGLSTDRIDTLVDVALAAGGLGAKISGGGLGGCMIALTDEPDTAQAVIRRLHEAGAARTWVVTAGKFASHVR